MSLRFNAGLGFAERTMTQSKAHILTCTTGGTELKVGADTLK